MTTKGWAGRRICAAKALPAVETTLHGRWPGRMRTLPGTKSPKEDVGDAAYWNTNMTCTASLRHMLYLPTIDIEPFLTKNEQRRKKKIEETYDVVL
jgi:hypothetical protein